MRLVKESTLKTIRIDIMGHHRIENSNTMINLDSLQTYFLLVTSYLNFGLYHKNTELGNIILFFEIHTFAPY